MPHNVLAEYQHCETVANTLQVPAHHGILEPLPFDSRSFYLVAGSASGQFLADDAENNRERCREVGREACSGDEQAYTASSSVAKIYSASYYSGPDSRSLPC